MVILELITTSDLDTIARRYDFEPLYSGEQTQSETKFNDSNHSTQWMNAGVLFTDKTIRPEFTRIDRTGFFFIDSSFNSAKTNV